MKIRLLAQVLAGVVIAIGTDVTLNQPSIASDATFSCSFLIAITIENATA